MKLSDSKKVIFITSILVASVLLLLFLPKSTGAVLTEQESVKLNLSISTPKVEITLNPNGGTIKEKTISIKINSSIYGELPNPERTGYIFLGWYTDPVDGSIVTSDTEYDYETSVTTLYAHWFRADKEDITNDLNCTIIECALESLNRI